MGQRVVVVVVMGLRVVVIVSTFSRSYDCLLLQRLSFTHNSFSSVKMLVILVLLLLLLLDCVLLL